MQSGFSPAWARLRTAARGATCAAGLVAVGACAHNSSTSEGGSPAPMVSGTHVDNSSGTPVMVVSSATAPNPDPRLGLKAGVWDAGQAAWNTQLISSTRPTDKFLGSTNSDLAFSGHYVIQGNYNGFQIWDVTNPAHPTLRTSYFCPASQSDVSVYKNLLFVSGEGLNGRLDCGAEGVKDTVSSERLRGVRIFDISDLDHPKNVGNVQTCRGSHTHTLVVDPSDHDNVYIYISGSSVPRSPSELAGCSGAMPSEDANTSLFRIDVIKVPLAHPEQAAIVSGARIFNGLTAVAHHHETPQDSANFAQAEAKGAYIMDFMGMKMIMSPRMTAPLLDSIVKARGGTGAPTGADSAALRMALPKIVEGMIGSYRSGGPTQCHDITVYPAIGLAGGACEGYGMLIDISNVVQPVRLDAVSDSNFSYWHSATFNNAGTKILFSDEWGGGGAPKCRKTDPREWGADAIFAINDRKMVFQSYYKLPGAQSDKENCVAHNGSLIPIPGRDVMVQAWYQGGISVFDWTDAAHPREIAFFDRGATDSTRIGGGGQWSAYWYNGHIYGSEMRRGLDVLELTPSAFLSKNEIAAAKSIQLPELNVQGQPKYVWPASFSLARAYLDQLERTDGLAPARIAEFRTALDEAEQRSGMARRDALTQLAARITGAAAGARDAAKTQMIASTVQHLESVATETARDRRNPASDASVVAR